MFVHKTSQSITQGADERVNTDIRKRASQGLTYLVSTDVNIRIHHAYYDSGFDHSLHNKQWNLCSYPDMTDVQMDTGLAINS